MTATIPGPGDIASKACDSNLICDKAGDAIAGSVKDAAGNALSSAFGKAMTELAEMMMEAVGKLVAGLGSIWIHVPTPDLVTDGPANSDVAGSEVGGGTEQAIVTLLGWVMWVGFGLAVMSLMVIGVKIAVDHRRGSETVNLGRLGTVLMAILLISGAAGLAGALVGQGPSQSTGTVGFIQDSLWFYTGAAVVLSVIIAGLKMAYEQRAQPGKELVASWFRFVLVSAAGVTAINMMLSAGDVFSVWILNASLECDLTGDKNCFGRNVTAMLGLSATSGLGIILILIFTFMAAVASIIQIGLMLMRNGLLVVLAGVLPLSASMTNTDTGRSMFKKTVTWTLALVLYKPTAAIIYATAFSLAGSDVFGGTDQILSVLSGLMLMIVALIALPALQKFITGAVSAVASGNAAGAGAMAAAAAIPTGAIAVGKMMGGGGGGDSKGGAPSGGPPSGGPTGSPSSGGPSGGAKGSSAPGGGGGAPASGGMKAGGSAVSGSGGGAAAAGGGAAAAAGPVGIAAMAAGATVGKATSTINKIGATGAEMTGEGSGG